MFRRGAPKTENLFRKNLDRNSCSGPLIKDFGWPTDRPVGQPVDVIDQRVDLLGNEVMLANRSNQLANR